MKYLPTESSSVFCRLVDHEILNGIDHRLPAFSVDYERLRVNRLAFHRYYVVGSMVVRKVSRFAFTLARNAVLSVWSVLIGVAMLYLLLGSPLLHILYMPLPHAGESSIYVPGK